MPGLNQYPISALYNIRGDFLRSAHIERDFKDATALDGYVLTPYAKETLGRLASGLRPQSGHRAWRVTGDYGTGKSSFALLLAHLFSENRGHLPLLTRNAVDFAALEIPPPKLLPVLVTASGECLSRALARSLHYALTSSTSRGRTPQIVLDLEDLLKGGWPDAPSNNTMVRLVQAAARYVTGTGKATGLLIVIDELGKFLEQATMFPDRQDVYLLQIMAEMAARSGKNPIYVVGLLHQGFNAYAEHLSQSAQKEWEKVAGRFEEIIFNQPVEQLAMLVGNALNVRIPDRHSNIIPIAKRWMTETISLGWYGSGTTKDSLIETAPQLYPLHPTVLPVLIKIFNRFGQNERSLFSFLLSDEPYGLQAFSAQPAHLSKFYRLHDLYDYTRATFGHKLATLGYRTHWSTIDSLIESFPADSEVELQILKTVGLLNLINYNALLPTDAAIEVTIAPQADKGAVSKVLERLHIGKHVLHLRGMAGGYCLWPYTSVNLDHALIEAKKEIGPIRKVIPFIKRYLEDRPVIARRHYVETGNLRHFRILYCSPSDAAEIVAANTQDHAKDDGYILVLLCETEEERREATRLAVSDKIAARPDILVSVPPALQGMIGLVQLAECWQWIANNTPELASDTYAAEEVSREVTASRQILIDRLQNLIGVFRAASDTKTIWFRNGIHIFDIGSGRAFLSYLSDMCDEIYDLAPAIQNELVNRRTLSSAAAGARMRLIEAVFKASSLPFLGMNHEKKPPEMSMYLSVLRRSNLHSSHGDEALLALPSEQDDICSILPVFHELRRYLKIQPNGRTRISDIFAHLRQAPFGIRDGLLPIFLAVFSVINEHEVAFYEDGAFLQEVEGEVFLRIIKVPSSFDIQLCEIAGVRAEVFTQLATHLNIAQVSDARLLSVVSPLCVFAAQLPEFTRRTYFLSAQAQAVRTALLAAEDPARLLFDDLPQACGFDSFLPNLKANQDHVLGFVTALKAAQEELRSAYSVLLNKIQHTVISHLDVPVPFPDARLLIADRVSRVLLSLTEPRLTAFCRRLSDSALPQREWLESIGSLVTSKPPRKWTDADIDRYEREIQPLCDQFKRVESIVFTTTHGDVAATGVRISVSRSDGNEVERILYTTPEDDAIASTIQADIEALMEEHPRIALVAASRVLWNALAIRNEEAG